MTGEPTAPDERSTDDIVASAPPPPPVETGVPPMPPVEPSGPVPPVRPTNGYATASLVLGIVSVVLCWTIWGGIVLGVLAVVFGALGIGRTKTGVPGKGMAVAGIVLGIVGIVGAILMVVFFVAVFSHTDVRFQQIQDCFQHPKRC